ncbi:MAG: DUF1403 family protein [Pseudomonadota bacterium]|nr:DUF1403 family protein [Pseudomonadota bacterium]
MTGRDRAHDDDRETLHRLPGWVTSIHAKVSEDVAFMSGAALGHLALAIRDADLPLHLLRDRLSLVAAEACLTIMGRPERAADLRDAVHLMRPGDLPGPAGEVYLTWRRAVARPVSAEALRRALPEADGIARWMDAGQGAPVAAAAAVLGTVMDEVPRGEVAALILCDAVLSRALGWGHVVPLVSCGIKPGDLRLRGAALREACHRAVVLAVRDALRLSSELTRRAAHLRAVTPKLRAKGAQAAVEMFLSLDAVAPGALPLPDRAARRLCDRLVDLGAVRELTGRDTFRLYGV